MLSKKYINKFSILNSEIFLMYLLYRKLVYTFFNIQFWKENDIKQASNIRRLFGMWNYLFFIDESKDVIAYDQWRLSLTDQFHMSWHSGECCTVFELDIWYSLLTNNYTNEKIFHFPFLTINIASYFV